MGNTKPFVTAASFCELVIEGKDNVLSAIRLIDTLEVTKTVLNAPPGLENVPLPDPAVEVTALITLKSGDVAGKSEVTLKVRTPTGDLWELPQKWTIELNGDGHGVNLVLKMVLPAGKRNAGQYWFDVYWQGELLTCFPLRLSTGDPEPVAAK